MAEDGRVEESKTKKGGYRTLPFILGNEIGDRFAMAGFQANMISYLTSQLHLPLVEASNTLNNFAGTSSVTPIIGALVADCFAGRFFTIVGGSVIYQLGMICLIISAVLPALRPPPCPPSPTATCQRAATWQLLALYASLLLTSIGSGGIRPNVVTFGADQFGTNRPRPKFGFFNLYFFSMNLSVLLALTVIVYVQDNVGWGWGFGIPAVVMLASMIAFSSGYRIYVRMMPAGSPLTRLAQVVVAAFKKREIELPTDYSSQLYGNKELDADISTTGKLLHTDQLRFFDRAAVLTSGDTTESGEPRLWRLSTVHRVEELKSIIRMIPMWSVGILLVTASSHNGSFAIMQAKSMDRHLSNTFQIPAATMSIFAIVAMLVTLVLYDRALVPLARRLTKRPAGLTHFQRIGIGLAISLLANVSAAAVETKRKSVAARHGLLDEKSAVVPMSVFWLVPQYAIHGVADALSTVGNLEFLYDQSPESMRSTAAALFWLAMSVGSFAGTALVTLVDRCTRGRGDWLQDNINRGKLDCYYWLVTGLQVFNFLAFLLAAKFYTYKPLELAGAAADGASKLLVVGETGLQAGRPAQRGGSKEEGPGSSNAM